MRVSRALVFPLIGVLAAIITFALYGLKSEFLSGIDLKLRDSRLKLRQEARPTDKVVIVAIDSKSINELGRWPWQRSTIAQLIDSLSEYGAKTIALDIIFAEPSEREQDKALSDSIKRNGNVIAGYYFREKEEGQISQSELIEGTKLKIIKLRDNVEEVPIEGFPEVETNIKEVALFANSAGYFNVIPDRDGLYRRANLIMLFNGDIYPSLALSALRHYLNTEPVLEVAIFGVKGLSIGKYSIPVDESGRLTLNFYGRHGVFKEVSAVDIIKKRLNKDSLKDTIVFVGPTEVGIGDIRATPIDPVLPGVEIHATAASNILEGRYLLRDGRVIGLEIASIIFFPILMTIGLAFIRRTLGAVIVFFAFLAGYFLLDFFIFNRYCLNTTMIFPAISLALSYIGAEAYRNLIEEQRARFLKKAFSSYVSPELVGEMMKNPDILKLGGEKRQISVLFSDIRGFTTISERLTPEGLVLLLNQYLDPMTKIILSNKGMLDKYIGDAIMAVFNAPLSVKEHSALACKSALEMLKKLKELNIRFKETNSLEIDIGIGINTGDAIVGNMGTDVRFDYTAIGDTVNLASRLEGLCKVYKTHIVVSEFTVRHVESLNGFGFKFRELDLIKVKGKDTPVRVFELMSEDMPELLEGFSMALSLYRDMRFDDALRIFEELSRRFNDGPSATYIERCRLLKESPPPEGWDRVYEAKTK